jgi:threonine dehydrogenase-like Zn-dependent dehydrogenase
MRAVAVFPHQGEIRIVDRADPKSPGPHQVLLRTREVGICGTDREIAAGDYGEPPPGADQLILGHEAISDVVEVGSAVRRLRPGQTVVPMVRRPCDDPDCLPCRAGRQDFCVTNRFTEHGIKQADGFLAELTVDEEASVLPIPDALRDVGVLIEPITVVAKGMDQVRKIRERLPWDIPYQRALVLGAGPVGLLSAMACLVNGYETIVFSREGSGGERAGFVRGLGARYVSSEETPLGQLGAELGPIDLILEAAGFSPLMVSAIEVLGPNGILMLTGVPGHRPASPVDTDLLMRRIVLGNQVIFGTVNAGRGDYAEAIHLLEAFMVQFPEAVRGLITGRFPLDEAPELLTTRGGIKNVVSMSVSS